MIYFITIGTIFSYLFGRSPLKMLDNLRFRYPFILIGALGAQLVLFVIFHLNPVQYSYLLELTILMMIVGLWLNRGLCGIKWIIVGAFFNLCSLLLHGGRMPVMDRALQIAHLPYTPDDARHQIMTPYDIWWMGDWIPLYKVVLSLGDVCVGIGIILFMIHQSPNRGSS